MTVYGDEKVVIYVPQPAPEDQAFKPAEAMDLCYRA
jgi:hypothetical protein